MIVKKIKHDSYRRGIFIAIKQRQSINTKLVKNSNKRKQDKSSYWELKLTTLILLHKALDTW